MHQGSIPLAGYRRALKFAVPYWPSLVLVLLTGVAATLFGLAQPYISKLLIDEALLKRNFDKLLAVSGLMLAATLSTLRSARSPAVREGIGVICFKRLASHRNCARFRRDSAKPAGWGMWFSRISNDVAGQRVSADGLLSVLGVISGGQRGHHGEPQCEIFR